MEQLSEGQCKWFALRVRTRCENLVKRALQDKGYTTFLAAYHDGQVENPYFPGYLFAQFNPFARLPVLTTPHVLHIVSFGRGPAEILPNQIDGLRKLVASGVPPIQCPYYHEGSRVRVVGGPMQGVEGIVLRHHQSTRLVISVDILMRSVAVEIDPKFVRAIGGGGQMRPLDNRVSKLA